MREAASSRGEKLREALEVQKFYIEADDMLQWLKDKQPEVTSQDYGKDDLSSMSYLTKLEALVMDLKTNQQTRLNSLTQSSAHLKEKNIARKLAEIELGIKSLIDSGADREKHINAMLKVFEFERECEATANWFKDQQMIAASQDFGADLEHAESLLKKFNEFILELNKNNDRITRIDAMAQAMCENKYTPGSYIDSIDERCSNLSELWRDLTTLAEVRRQTLEGAIEVHAFDKDCDDLITWAVEKEGLLKEEDIGYDLASVFTLAKQQESLETELSALKEELDRLKVESNRLSNQYPETREHIEHRLNDANATYNDVYQQLMSRKEKINQSQAMFLFANEFNELSDWLREMLVKITSAELAGSGSNNEVNNAELLLKRHKEYKIEIDMQQGKIQKLITKSEDLMSEAKRMKDLTNQTEVKSKIEAISAANKNLIDTWQSRQDLYEQNLEYIRLSREIKLLDAWLSSKDGYVHTDVLGDSVHSVETLLKQHNDFELMLSAMEPRFEGLRRENKIEKIMKELKQKEQQHKLLTDEKFEEEKKKDAERKKNLEKRRQDDRRKTQEIMTIVGIVGTLGGTIGVQANAMSANTNSGAEVKRISSFARNLEVDNSIANISKETSKPDIIIEAVNVNPEPINTPIPTAAKLKKDRNRTRSIRDKYRLPIILPEPTIKSKRQINKRFNPLTTIT